VAGLGIGVRQLARIDRRRLPAPIGDGFAWICALLACWDLGEERNASWSGTNVAKEGKVILMRSSTNAMAKNS
jgi:hypothetical protein